jgi:hypothetical protein
VRRLVRSRCRRAPFVSELEPLLDILMHSQDICVPLGIQHPMPLDAAAAAADRVLSLRGPVRLWNRPRGVRLVATDIDWAYADGPERRASIQSHLMPITGRESAPSRSNPATP